MPADAPITVIDRHPSPLRSGYGFRIVEYRIPPALSFLHDKGIPFSGVLEALLTFCLLLLHGAREVHRSAEAIIYVPTSEIPWTTFAAGLLARLFGVRLVLANLNTRIAHSTSLFGLVGWLLWSIHSRADQVIALSGTIADELKALRVRDNVAVNSCGFERSQYVRLPRDVPSHAAIYVGRIERGKGVDDLLTTWLSVNRRISDADLRLAGYSSPHQHRSLVQRRKDLSLESVVELIGVVSDQAKWSLYAESRVCVFLSHIEGWGLVPLEALSSGLPVVLYDLPCYQESLRGLTGAFTVPLGDTEAAAAEVIRLLTMPNDDYMSMSESIASSFDYVTWAEVAVAELGLILGQDSVAKVPTPKSR